MLCIYCQELTAGTKGLAHVVPEAVMQNEVTLPLGAVCDDCNGYLSDLDTAVLMHPGIWPIIQWYGIPGKGGRPRKRIGHMERRERGTRLHLDLSGKHVSLRGGDPGTIEIDVNTGANFDEWKFRRGLHHIGLNALAYVEGVDFVHQSVFDQARQYIRSPIGRKQSWPYGQIPYAADSAEVAVKTISRAPGATCELFLLGHAFYIDVANSGELASWLGETYGERAEVR